MASIIWVVCVNNMEALGEVQNPTDQVQVVWPERHNGNLDIYFSRLTASGWTTKIPLSEAPATELMPAIAAGGNGVSWVVWTADSGTKGSDLFYVYSNEGGWSDPARIPTGLLFNTAPSIMMDEEDRPWIAWSGSDGKGSDIFFSRWNGSGWEMPSRVNQADSTPDVMPLIGTDAQGTPWICWFGFDGDQYRPYASKWSADGWGQETESGEDNLYKALLGGGYRASMSMLPSFLSDPEKAGVYVPGKGRLHSVPVRYLNLGRLIEGAASSGRTSTKEMESATGLVIICFGDSITQGVPYVEDPGDGRRVGGYEPPLETLLAADFRPSQALNWGVGGEITLAGSQRIDDVLTGSGGNYVLILEGTNDYYQYTYTDTIIYLGNMIDKSREANVIPIIATLTPDTVHPEKQIAETYNPAIKDLAAQKKVMLADQYAGLINNWASLNADGVHPNQDGYNAMASIWFYAIPEKPTVTTGEATDIGYTTARLNGTVNPNGTITTYYFEYGTTTAYGKSTPVTSAGSGTKTLSVNTSVVGLVNETPYHYRLRAKNEGGTTFGADRTFTTHRPTCDGCIGDVVLIDGVTYGADTDCECIAGTSITIGPDVTVESGAHVTFIAPSVIIKSGFNAKSGSVVDIAPP